MRKLRDQLNKILIFLVVPIASSLCLVTATRILFPPQPEIVTETRTEVVYKTLVQKEVSPLILEELGVYAVTAYTSLDPGVNSVTADGSKVVEGVTVAASKEIPFGTKIFIEGVGIRVVQDRGHDITPGHLDLYFSNPSDAKNFGVKGLTVWRMDLNENYD